MTGPIIPNPTTDPATSPTTDSATNPTTDSATNPTTNRPATLVRLADSDLPELAQFIASQSGRQSSSVEKRLRWFLLENPARQPDLPLGWGLRLSQAELVGCILYTPQTFRFQQQTFLLIGSSSFYVDDRYRGSGGLIFLRFSELARKSPIFGNSANPDSARLWQARGAVPIPYSDHEMFGVLRWQGVIEEALHRRKVPEKLARITSHPAAPVSGLFKRLKLVGNKLDLRPITSPEELRQMPVQGFAPAITANRDLPYIRWRYFSGQDATVAVFTFRNRDTGANVLVTVNQRSRGYREQIRTLNVLDIYPTVGAEVCASIIAALIDRYRGAIDTVVLRGMDEATQAFFRRRGFIRRPLDAPSGWFLDKSGLLPAKDWYTVPADGDLAI